MPDPVRSIGHARSQAAQRLAATSETAALDAELLLRDALGVDRVDLLLRDPEPIPADVEERFQQAVERRLAGEPVAYILGRKGFRTIELFVDERVLIPRPETEELVGIALEWLETRPRRRIVDVGTGSGAIALALASEREGRQDLIVATERYRSALDVAALNRDSLGHRWRVHLVLSDLLSGVTGSFDLILANLPYLNPTQLHPSTAREPQNALFSGEDGFDLYRALFQDVGRLLAPGGLIVAEIDPSQAVFGASYAAHASGLPVAVRRDGAGRERFLLIGEWA